MDLVGPLRELSLEINLEAHGLDITVTVGESEPVATRGIWLTNQTQDVPAALDFARRQPIRIMAISRLVVSLLPTGSLVEAPEYSGGESITWRVEGPASKEALHNRVYLVPVEPTE